MSSALALPGLSDDKSGFRKHVRGPDGPKLFREEPDCLRWGVDFRGHHGSVVGLFHSCVTALFYPFPLFMTFIDIHALICSCKRRRSCWTSIARWMWQTNGRLLMSLCSIGSFRLLCMTPCAQCCTLWQLHLLRFHVRPGCWGEECKQWNWRILAFQSVRVRVGLHVRNCETLRIIRLPSFVASWRVCRKRTNPLSCWRWKARTQKISN